MMSIFNMIYRNHLFLKRKNIEEPECFQKLDEKIEMYSHGFFPDVSSNVMVKLWEPELGGCCVTIVLDKLLTETIQCNGRVYVVLRDEVNEDCGVDHYVNIGSIEMISSGVRYRGNFRHLTSDVMVLDIDKKWSKSLLKVPDDPFRGFSWYDDNTLHRVNKKFHNVVTKDLGGEVVLNFAVCGEFDLSIYFCGQGGNELQHIFSKGFCCK